MPWYPTLLMAATLVSAASAGFLYAQAPHRRTSQLLAAILVLGAWWSGGELGGSLSSNPEDALRWMRLAALGWLPIGALIPHLAFHALDQSQPSTFRPYRKLQAFNAWFQTAWSAVMAGVVLGSDGWVVGLTARSWGWSGSPGQILEINYSVVTVGVIVTSFIVFRCRNGRSSADSLQIPWIWLGILLPTAVVFLTDILLPGLSVDVPRMGAASIALGGMIVSWTVIHYGMSMISPHDFGNEILETLDESVAVVSRDGSIVRANRGLVRLSGYPLADLTGMRMESLLESESGAASRSGDMRRMLRHARGERIPVAVSAAVLRERQDNEVGVVMVLRDLRELEDLRRSSMVNARLAAVGELAAGLAHEINNPMAFVGANLRMLQGHWAKVTATGADAKLDDDNAVLVEEGREIIVESLEGIERATDIVRRMKNFTHVGSGEREPAYIADLIQDCLKLVGPQLGPGIRIALDFGDLPPIVCCAPEIEQVFLNLLVNAIHAVDGEGLIEISTRMDGSLAVASVRDDGRGMRPDVLDRIFDPFFTTKSVGEGTGLGLGIAHQVVTQHGGVITVQSKPGEGSTFKVHLPVSDLD